MNTQKPQTPAAVATKKERTDSSESFSQFKNQLWQDELQLEMTEFDEAAKARTSNLSNFYKIVKRMVGKGSVSVGT